MDVQEWIAKGYLAEIDHIMTEIDIELMEWNAALDRISLAGVFVPVELWTNDDPPLQITSAALANAVGTELRVMHHVNGEWTKVGTAKVDSDGRITAEITEDVPELKRSVIGGVSIQEPLAHFEVGPDGKWKQNYPLVGFDNDPEIRRNLKEFIDWDVDNNVPLKKNPAWSEALENHPFFDKQKED